LGEAGPTGLGREKKLGKRRSWSGVKAHLIGTDGRRAIRGPQVVEEKGKNLQTARGGGEHHFNPLGRYIGLFGRSWGKLGEHPPYHQIAAFRGGGLPPRQTRAGKKKKAEGTYVQGRIKAWAELNSPTRWPEKAFLQGQPSTIGPIAAS